jgi:hypothetical protein
MAAYQHPLTTKGSRVFTELIGSYYLLFPSLPGHLFNHNGPENMYSVHSDNPEAGQVGWLPCS